MSSIAKLLASGSPAEITAGKVPLSSKQEIYLFVECPHSSSIMNSVFSFLFLS
jgi:hypothetical protein